MTENINAFDVGTAIANRWMGTGHSEELARIIADNINTALLRERDQWKAIALRSDAPEYYNDVVKERDELRKALVEVADRQTPMTPEERKSINEFFFSHFKKDKVDLRAVCASLMGALEKIKDEAGLSVYSEGTMEKLAEDALAAARKALGDK